MYFDITLKPALSLASILVDTSGPQPHNCPPSVTFVIFLNEKVLRGTSHVCGRFSREN